MKFLNAATKGALTLIDQLCKEFGFGPICDDHTCAFPFIHTSTSTPWTQSIVNAERLTHLRGKSCSDVGPGGWIGGQGEIGQSTILQQKLLGLNQMNVLSAKGLCKWSPKILSSAKYLQHIVHHAMSNLRPCYWSVTYTHNVAATIYMTCDH